MDTYSNLKVKMSKKLDEITKYLRNYKDLEDEFKILNDIAIQNLNRQIQLFKIAREILINYSSSSIQLTEYCITEKHEGTFNLVDFVAVNKILNFEDYDLNNEEDLCTIKRKLFPYANKVIDEILSILNQATGASFFTDIICIEILAPNRLFYSFVIDFN